MKQVVITGVSTGIGYACVKLLLSREFRVDGSVRNQSDAGRLQRDFGERFVPLLFDVTDEETVQAEAAKVSEHLGTNMLDGLVNNAGIEVAGPLAHLPTDQFQHQLEVNLVGPFIVTKAFLPLLGADPARKGIPGRIVNISSAGGKIAGPFTGAYSASKFGLEGRQRQRVGCQPSRSCRCRGGSGGRARGRLAGDPGGCSWRGRSNPPPIGR